MSELLERLGGEFLGAGLPRCLAAAARDCSSAWCFCRTAKTPRITATHATSARTATMAQIRDLTLAPRLLLRLALCLSAT